MKPSDLEPSDAEGVALARWIKWVNWTPYLAGGVLAVLVVAYVIAFVQNGWSKNPDAWGQLGDYIGGLLNPLVAGFALMALVVSVRLQKAELAATRKELENSRLAMQEQATTAEYQRREQRFFDFLNLYQVTLETIGFEERTSGLTSLVFGREKPTTSPVTRTGKSAFRLLTSSWTSPIKSLSPLFVANNENSDPMPAEETIIKSWDGQSSLLDHYFRTVFTLLREAKSILQDDHFRFIKLFRAQLSRDEVNLIAMNLLYDKEGKKMRELVARYGILKHMPENTLRTIAERDLDPLSFGRKWVEKHLTSAQATPC